MDYTSQQENILAYRRAEANGSDEWVAACGGLERWTPGKDGRRYIYVYNFATGEHGYREDIGGGLFIIHDNHPDLM